MFTLNLLFDLNNSNGRFSGDRDGSPAALFKSNNWLKLREAEPANPNPPAFDPERNVWKDKGEAGTLLVIDHLNPNQNICVRVASDPTGPPVNLATTTVTLVVAFGATLPAAQTHASPFTTDGTPNGPVKTTFVFSSTGNTSGGWFFPLGRIAKVPSDPDVNHRFQFAVGVIVQSGGQTLHYGEDPDMDVGT